VESKGLMKHLLQNYLDKHDAVNNTAKRLTENNIPVLGAWNVHR